MNLQDAINILSSRTKIGKAGKYRVKVSFCGDFHKQLERGAVVAIANFSAYTPYHKEKAIELVKAGDFQGALNQNLSLSIRDTDYRPAKGEIVDIMVTEKENKDGVLALFVDSLTPIEASTGTKEDFSALLEEAPAEAGEAGDEA